MSKFRYLYLAFILTFIVAFGGARIVEASSGAITLHPVNGIWQAVADTTDDIGDQLGDANVLENWQLIVAFLIPLALAFIMKQEWEPWKKSLIAFGVSLVISLVGSYLKGDYQSGADVIANILKLFVLTIAFYTGFWRNANINTKVGAK